MHKEKNSRAKLIVSIASLLVAVISLLIAVFAVYAVTQQSAKSHFNISYSVKDDIAIGVAASYKVENKSEVDIGEIVFNVDNTQNNGTLTVDEAIELTTPTAEQPISHKYVEFFYKFTNLNDSQTTKISATWQTFTTLPSVI